MTIKLPVFGIAIEVEDDGVAGIVTEIDKELLQPGEHDSYAKGVVDGITALLLAMACAGVDMESPAMVKAIETAVEQMSNEV